MSEIDKKISSLIPQQVPQFVRDDHDKFVSFLEAYYEYLEQANTEYDSTENVEYGKTIDRAKKLLTFRDVDETIDVFSQKLYGEFLNLIPKETLANRDTLLKNIKDFYRSRGTEKSYKFLFRALFNKESEFYYPKQDILIASSGKWVRDKTLIVTDVMLNDVLDTSLATLELFENKEIVGVTSNATAAVERVQIYYKDGQKVYQLYISNVVGNFERDEEIISNVTGTILKATILSGSVVKIIIFDSGTGYQIGDNLIFEGGGGNGAAAIVSTVSPGNVLGVTVVSGGAGFRSNDYILFTGGGGSGANAKVGALQGVANSFYHANTYNINSDIIATFANVVLNAANYGFPTFANANINSTMIQTWTQFEFGSTGPINETGGGIIIVAGGNNYTSLPMADPLGNTRIKTLGVLGRMRINNGGTNYQVGDKLIFTNTPFWPFGVGANASVKSINANGTITLAQFDPEPGYLTGGMGYVIDRLPTITVNSANGVNANIVVTALLGYGTPATELTVSKGIVGQIEKITIQNQGSGYSTAPTINLTASGDGTAQAVANIITGVYTQPGKYLDDTGFLSGFNFLQDRDYYQQYSYVIKVSESIDKYRKYIKNMVHPGGTKMFGNYMITNSTIVNNTINATVSTIDLSRTDINLNAVSFSNTTNTYLFRTNGNFRVANSGNTEIFNSYYGFPNFSNIVYTLVENQIQPISTSNSQGTLSVWVKPNTIPNTVSTIQTILFGGNSAVNTSMSFGVFLGNTAPSSSNTSGNYIEIVAKDIGGNTILQMRTNTRNEIITNNWIHLIGSWDLSNTSKRHLYMSNVSSKNVIVFTANTYINYNIASFSVGANTNGTSKFDGCISELWFDSSYIDISNITLRGNFINTKTLLSVNQGNYGNTGSGTYPLLYLKGNYLTFATNHGTFGNLNTNGSLISCNDSPNFL